MESISIQQLMEAVGAQRLDQGGVSGGGDQVFSGEGDLLIRPRAVI